MKILIKEQIPQASGVYFFRDKHGRILYIGKAVNLRTRIASYIKTRQLGGRTAKLVKLTEKINWQETNSEIEALISESQLIKKHKPPFNVMLRDDKQYFFVGIIPRARSSTEVHSKSSGQAKEQFPRIFLTHQPLLTIHYPLLTSFVGPFTDGAALKTTLKLLRRVFPYCTCKQQHNNYCLNYHIGKCPGFCCLKKSGSNFQRQEYLKNIKAIKGILEGKRNSLIKQLKKEMLELGKKNEFEKAIELRYKIEKLEKVFENAKILRNLNVVNGKTPIEQFRKSLGLPRALQRIEGYDISNIQGKFATGAMVVFIDGMPNKSQYRKFKIRLGDKPDDIAMLKEVLTRRFNHPKWPYPDLMVIDGGKAQLGVTRSVIPKNIPVLALTKNEKHRGSHIFLNNKKVAISLKSLPLAVGNLILQIDAEAHRFAISYYRKLHKIKIIS